MWKYTEVAPRVLSCDVVLGAVLDRSYLRGLLAPLAPTGVGAVQARIWA